LKWATKGDASESALIKFAQPIRDIINYRTEFPTIYTIPFNSKNKWQLNLVQSETKTLILMKGAPEMVLKYCDKYMQNGQAKPRDEEFEKKFLATIKTLSSYGERILGFCEMDITGQQDIIFDTIQNVGLASMKKVLPADLNLPRTNMTFIGLTALIDPPKEGVPEAVTHCSEAGIRYVFYRMFLTCIELSWLLVITLKQQKPLQDKLILSRETPLRTLWKEKD
jgi:sodium/potassium-transporting ATPase subunit alpha